MYRRRSERGNPITRLCSPAFGIRLLVKLFMWWTMQNAFRCNGQREYRVAVDHGSRDDDHHNVRYASWPSRRKVRKRVVDGQPAVKSSLGRDFVKHPPPGTMCRAGHGDRSLPLIMNKRAPGSRVVNFFITFHQASSVSKLNFCLRQEVFCSILHNNEKNETMGIKIPPPKN